jgi:hypothetical protein
MSNFEERIATPGDVGRPTTSNRTEAFGPPSVTLGKFRAGIGFEFGAPRAHRRDNAPIVVMKRVPAS